MTPATFVDIPLDTTAPLVELVRVKVLRSLVEELHLV